MYMVIEVSINGSGANIGDGPGNSKTDAPAGVLT